MTLIARRARALAAALVLAGVTALPALGTAPASVLAAGLAVDDVYATAEDMPLVIAAPGILANDGTPADGNVLCVGAVDAAGLSGSLDWHADGSFSYSPTPDFDGDESANSFTYTLYEVAAAAPCVGGPGTTATVAISVTPVNDAPTATADSFSALENMTLNIRAPGVLANDADVDGDALTAVKVSGPAHGVVVLAADGSFSYTPATGYVGTDGFSYRASDGSATSAARVVTIAVKAIPKASPTPVPTRAPTPMPSPTPAPTDTPEPTASETPEPPASDEPIPTFEVSTAQPTSTPVPSLAPVPAAREGGLPLPVLLVLVLFGMLVLFGGVFGLTRWLNARRGEA